MSTMQGNHASEMIMRNTVAMKRKADTAALVMALSPLGGRIHAFLTEEREKELVPDLCCLLLMVLSVLSLAQSGFHPFIYFQF